MSLITISFAFITRLLVRHCQDTNIRSVINTEINTRIKDHGDSFADFLGSVSDFRVVRVFKRNFSKYLNCRFKISVFNSIIARNETVTIRLHGAVARAVAWAVAARVSRVVSGTVSSVVARVAVSHVTALAGSRSVASAVAGSSSVASAVVTTVAATAVATAVSPDNIGEHTAQHNQQQHGIVLADCNQNKNI